MFIAFPKNNMFPFFAERARKGKADILIVQIRAQNFFCVCTHCELYASELAKIHIIPKVGQKAQFWNEIWIISFQK
jgi:hypothetical protein